MYKNIAVIVAYSMVLARFNFLILNRNEARNQLLFFYLPLMAIKMTQKIIDN